MTIHSSDHPFVPLEWQHLEPDEMRARAKSFYELLDLRRSVREFSDRPVPRDFIEQAILTASTAPSGAHRQPWRFVCVSDAEVKRSIRQAAEKEELESYQGGRMPAEWLEALAPLGTDWEKPHLEIAPWLVVLFEENHGHNEDGSTRKNYYVKESVGICAGLFIAALHNMGLATLTHTPSPMKFLTRILGRPSSERPFVLFPVGYPADDAQVPDLRRKTLDEIAVWDPSPVADDG